MSVRSLDWEVEHVDGVWIIAIPSGDVVSAETFFEAHRLACLASTRALLGGHQTG